MKRTCPNCSSDAVPVRELLFGDCRCRNCLAVIGVHRVASALATVAIFSIAVVTTLVVLIELDVYAALLWFTFPVGALSYLKVRFCPLERKRDAVSSRGTRNATHRPG